MQRSRDKRCLGEEKKAASRSDVCAKDAGAESHAEYPVKSGARTVQILEFFRDRKAPARAIDVGRYLELSPSSANDLLKTLAEIGYLEFDEKTKFYFIGARAAMFGHWAAGVNPSVGKLEDFARELSRRTGECVVLSTYCKGTMLLLTVIHGPDATLPPHVEAGQAVPVVETAAGAAVLMGMARDDLLQLAKRTFHLKKVDKVADPLLRAVDRFKQQGYAVSLNDTFMPGFWALALPLPCKISFYPIVVAVCGPKSRIRRREQELVAAARELIATFFRDFLPDGRNDRGLWDFCTPLAVRELWLSSDWA
jgi:DNA-binding IclR family transcriptional regulator